ncbi:hypothetical protein [Streptomyces halobius]|uniref:ATP-grasp target RiPP n=1 Tax=Streptomyces halobius TaxID=2879846 RepID=A0ABY4M412_9ACTN|nr:hypothetical protein [Streptomyces halobius]UQA92494.1 hypothetical protein K9S39_12200 [Streptomyces halobius]
MPNPPLTHPSAEGRYRLTAFRHADASPITTLGPTDIVAAPHTITDTAAGSSYTLITTDPLGRDSPPATIPAA